MKMKDTIHGLRLKWWAQLALAVVLLVLGEAGVVSAEAADGDPALKYYMDLGGVAAILILVPLSLKLLTFVRIKACFADRSEADVCRAYGLWSAVRLGLLGLTMAVGLANYFVTQSNTGMLCVFVALVAQGFCYPSAEKLMYETGLQKPVNSEKTTDKQESEA